MHEEHRPRSIQSLQFWRTFTQWHSWYSRARKGICFMHRPLEVRSIREKRRLASIDNLFASLRALEDLERASRCWLIGVRDG